MAEAGPEGGTLVLLLHGFPESWFSWRHQLTALGDAGYFAVAPDVRGYGGSDAPPEIADYDIHHIAGDLLGLLRTYNRSQAYLVGHDFGASYAWMLARMFPQVFPAICTMSVPDIYFTPQSLTPVESMVKRFGDFGDPEQRFFYMLYHNEHEGRSGPAEAEYDDDRRRFLLKIFTDPALPVRAPEIADPRRVAGGMMGRMATAKQLPPWLPEADFEYVVAQYAPPAGHGFRSAVNHYRNLDRNRLTTGHLAGTLVHQPTLFLAGDLDPVLYFSVRGYPDQEAREKVMRQVEDRLRKSVPNLQKAVFFQGVGHCVQQQRPDEVSQELLGFLGTLPPLPAGLSKL